jgi:upstream activation factor subunit UAF30
VKLEKGSFKGKAADSSSKTKGATFTKKGSESSKPKKKVKVENGEGGEKKPNGLNKEMAVSGDLAKVIMCGEAASRPQVVKKMWEYIKEHSLQNPSDKREILLNSALRGVFKVKSFTMFAMNKHLSDYLSPLP